MANEVILEGLEQLNFALELAKQKLFILASKAVEEITKEGVKEAKVIITKMGAVDTGALRESIEGGVTKVTPSVEVEGQVGAGTDKVIQGAGRFTFSRKIGKDLWKKTPTSEYAENVEFGRGVSRKAGARPFMTSTYNYLRDLTTKKMASILRQAIGRI